VFDVKDDGRKRARLVAKGFSQVEGLDFDRIFSPVVRFETVRLTLAMAALNNWKAYGLDVRNAYLYGELHEEIYMEQPEREFCSSPPPHSLWIEASRSSLVEGPQAAHGRNGLHLLNTSGNLQIC